MQYRREIDGLRAVAVIPVIFYHTGVEVFSGGFVGVDIFFVISGYLITSIIVDDCANGTFSMRKFYERRARRILPALFFIMLCCIPVAWLTMAPHQMKDFSQSLLAATAFASNIFFYTETDYFNDFAHTSPLLHTWSLAIEEQFYVVFPFFILGMRRYGRNPLVISIAIIAVSSLLLSEWGWRNEPVANFYLTPSRAWELMVGAMGAFLHFGGEQRRNNALSALGLALIIISIFYFNGTTPFPSVYTLAPVAGTLLIILFGPSGTWVGGILSTRTLVGIGLVSYSAYLWHQPILAFARIIYIDQLTPTLMALCLILTMTLSVISWRAIEKPFRSGLFTTKYFFLIFLLGSVFFVSFGYIGHKTVGFRSYKLESLPADTRQYVIDRNEELSARQKIWGAVNEIAEAEFNESKTSNKILILGDSVARDLFVVTLLKRELFPGSDFRNVKLEDTCMSNFISFYKDKSEPELNCQDEILLLSSSGLIQSADTVILSAAWRYDTIYAAAELAKVFAGEGKKVIVFGASNFNDATSMSMSLAKRGIRPPEAKAYFFNNIRQDWRKHSIKLKSLLAGKRNIRFFDKAEIFCDFSKRECQLYDDQGKPYIYDTEHVTVTGANFFGARLHQLGWLKE